ncbi:MAG TPA: hypothetical protein VG845_00365, partial [Dehalococcoidia bacterium]|nr:hypothetical protein [Dehalococcoidia bacterium]
LLRRGCRRGVTGSLLIIDGLQGSVARWFTRLIHEYRHPAPMELTIILGFGLLAALGSLGVLVAYLYGESKH